MSRVRSTSSPKNGAVIGVLMFIVVEEGVAAPSVTDERELIEDAGERLRVILRLRDEREDMMGEGWGLCILLAWVGVLGGLGGLGATVWWCGEIMWGWGLDPELGLDLGLWLSVIVERPRRLRR